jgi:AAA domain
VAKPVGALRTPEPARARPVEWVWKGRVPIGRISLIVGNEGVGKGTVVTWLASRVSRGTLEGDLHGAPSNVLIVGDEDALDDTWTPRLYAAGAEWRRVFFPPEAAAEIDFTAAADIERLRHWIRDHQIRVVVFDALLDHLGGASVDEFKAKAVRNALRPLRRLAREENVAALGSMHPRKGRALAFRDLIANSHQFNAVSRSSLLLAEHPDDETRRVLVRGKGNLAGAIRTLEFRIRSHVFELNGHDFDQPHAVDWEESELKIADVLHRGGGPGRPRDDDKRDKVEAALGAEPQSERALAKATGIPRSTVQDILREFDEDGEATRTPTGWVAGNQRPLITGHPPMASENGSSKPNQGGRELSGNEDSGTPLDGVLGHPDCSCVDTPPVADDGRCSRCWGWPS